jgi:formiminoglutamase
MGARVDSDAAADGCSMSFVYRRPADRLRARGYSVLRTLMRVEHLRTPTPDEIRTMTTLRDGEVRLGQRVGIVGPEGQTPAGTQVVLVGIPEDIGVRANLGRAGARRMWRAFLPRFLNMQSNTFLDGATVAVAGCIDVRDLNKTAKGIDATIGGPRARADALLTLRDMVSEIDRRVASVIEALRRSGVVPIVIGGGHNNAYGILAGCARASGQSLGCVNIDLHADLRPCEGRHSGNAFTYARADGHLDRYAVVGMSEAWATQSIITAIESDARTAAFTFESMLRGGVSPLRMAELAAAHVAGSKATLELDLDAVAQAPASAAAASGFSGAEFRSMATMLANTVQLQAAHIAEGAPGNGAWPTEMLAKLVAELTRDIATAVLRSPRA